MTEEALAALDAFIEKHGCIVAYDKVRDALRAQPGSTDLRHRMTQAHEALGEFDDAETLAEALIEEGQATDALLQFTARRRRHRGLAGDRRALEAAFAAYERAAPAHAREPWHDIHRAVFAMALGNADDALAIASAVVGALDTHGASTHADAVNARAWALSARGQAAALLDDLPGATAACRDLVEKARVDFSWDVVTATRQNMRLLLDAGVLPGTDEAQRDLMQALAAPPVTLAVGHMLDAPDRAEPRFTAGMLGTSQRAIEAFLDEHRPGMGIGSLACGTDILFQEALADRGLYRVAVLPFPKDEFVRGSVLRNDGCGWRSRFLELWRGAGRRQETSPHRFPGEALCYEFGNEVTTGLALLMADELETNTVGFALWDGKAGDGGGGTESVVRLWNHLGISVQIADVERLRAGETALVPLEDQSAPPDHAPCVVGETGVVALLFCDAKGFSKLCEEGTSAFATKILQLIADVAAPFDVFEANTWGDAVFFALQDVEQAGDLALKMLEELERERDEFDQTKLPQDLDFRLALHAAPVQMLKDPIRGSPRVSGAQIAMPARIEAITPAGHVLATESFAALSRVRRAKTYRCRFVGEADLPKDYGTKRLYVLDRD